MHFNSRYTSLTFLLTLFLSSTYLLLVRGTSLGSSCTEDYECPNAPYSFCSTHVEGLLAGCNTLPGFKIDTSSQNLYFLSRCDQSRNFTLLPYPKGDPGKVGLYSVNLNGSSLQQITTISETTGTPQYSIVDSFLGLSPNDFFIVKIQRDGPILYSVDRVDFTSNEISLGNSTPIALDYDFSINRTFACLNGEVVNYQDMSTLSAFSTVYNSTELPSGFICERVVIHDSNLFVLGATQFGEKILEGSTNGISSLATIFSDGTIFSFDVASSTVYFTNFTGLYSFLNNVTTTLDAKDSPYLSTQFYQNKVYYQSLTTIYSLDQSSQQSINLLTLGLNGSESTCQCREGFSGSSCSSCSGSLQWYSNTPVCVPILPDTGFPAFCSSSYQCGNVPFTVCEGYSCSCASGFTGPLCANCSGVVEWQNGSPVCVSLNQNGFPVLCSQDWECGNVPYTKCNSDNQCDCLEGFTGSNCQSCNVTVAWNNGIPSCSL